MLIGPKTGKDVTSPSDIKRVSLKYLVNLLTNKPPPPEFKDHIFNIRKLHFTRMEENFDNDVDEWPVKVVLKTFENLARKPGTKYDFIVKAGISFKNALFNILKIVWRTENIRKGWMESKETQLKKGKTTENILDYFRNIQNCNCSALNLAPTPTELCQ